MLPSERVRSLVLAIHRTDPKADEWRAHIRQLAHEVAALEGILQALRVPGRQDDLPNASSSALLKAQRRIDALQTTLDEAAAVIDDLLLGTDRLWKMIEAANGVDWRAVEAALEQTNRAQHMPPLRRLLRAATDAATALPPTPASPRHSPSGQSA